MSSWQTLTSLAVPRCHAGLVNIQGRLYLVGGRTPANLQEGRRPGSVDTVERYNDQLDKWQLLAKLRSPRHDAACAAVGQFYLL